MMLNFRFLLRLVVIEYYKQNAGLFLFLFLLFFGIIPPQHLIQTHIALIQAQLTSVPLTMGIMFFWVLYAVRCVRFMESSFAEYRHSFLYVFQQISRNHALLYVALCFILMYLPVLIYVSVVMVFAWYGGIAWYLLASAAITFLVFTSSMVLATKAFLVPGEKRPARIKLTFLPKFNNGSTGLRLMLLTYFWRDKRIGLIAQKIFSYTSFNFFFIRNAEIFRADYFTFFIFLFGAMNALLIYNCHKMMEEKMMFLRNLPISMINRVTLVVIIGVILFIPELLMMLFNGHEVLTIQEAFILYGLLATQFTLLFSILYTSRLSFKKYAQYIFILLFSLIALYLILHPALIILFNLGFSYLIYQEHYHTYEHKASIEGHPTQS